MRLQIVFAFMILFVSQKSAFGWSESYYHIIASIAFRQLTPEKQSKLLKVLEGHPKYKTDFALPPNLTNKQAREWLVGRASCWPEFDKSERDVMRYWEKEAVATIVLGNITIEGRSETKTGEWQVAKKLELCKQSMKDSSKNGSERALALCRIGYLVSNIHHPANAGSLFAESVLPRGDANGKLIPVKQNGGSLRTFWDELLGEKFEALITEKHLEEIQSSPELLFMAEACYGYPPKQNPEDWLIESKFYALNCMYTLEAYREVLHVMWTGEKEIVPVSLSEEYMASAKFAMQFRAKVAGLRLAAIWEEILD